MAVLCVVGIGIMSCGGRQPSLDPTPSSLSQEPILAAATPSPAISPSASMRTPPPVPTPSPSPQPQIAPKSAASDQSVPARVAAAWPGNDREAIAVARCESGNFRHDVVFGPTTGRAGELGVMQILPRYHRHRWTSRGWTDQDMFVPERNVRVAWGIWQESGWGAWTCQP